LQTVSPGRTGIYQKCEWSIYVGTPAFDNE
jgi:hypothetical protein